MLHIPAKVQRLNPLAILPVYSSEGAMCFDLHALLSPGDRRCLPPNSITAVPTGLAFELPPGWGLNVFARSGLAKHGITLANGVGKIDPDYRGELQVLLLNLSGDDFIVRHGDRIAQAEPVQVVRATFSQVAQLSETERGAGGFGSTGVAA